MTPNRLLAEIERVFGSPPQSPRVVVRVQVATGADLQSGREEADRFVDAGADFVVLDSEGASPAVLAALAAMLDLEPVGVVGTTSAPDWSERVIAVRDALRMARPFIGSPERMVEQLDDPVLSRLVGLLDRLSARRTPVLLGGGTATAAAALIVTRMQPGARDWWLAGSRPVVDSAASALQSAGLTPLLDLGLDTGSADLAMALVRAALEQAGA